MTTNDFTKIQGKIDEILIDEKSTALKKMAAGVAHEINNPLSFIAGDLSLLENDFSKLLSSLKFSGVSNIGPLQEKINRKLERCREGSSRIKKVIEAIREFSCLDKSEMHICDVNKALEATLSMMENEKKSAILVEKKFSSSISEIYGNGLQINQVFYSLLLNAYQAIENEGLVEVETGSHDGQHIFVKIKDNGAGIVSEHLANVFDPFFTTKPVGTGLGVGLTIAQSIIKKHNGKINIDSVLNEGTEVSIILPLKSTN